MRALSKNRHDLTVGTSLIEILLAVSIFSIGLLAYLNSFYVNHRAVESVNETDEVHIGFENTAEFLGGQTFSELFDTYNNSTFEIPNLTAPDGSDAACLVTCFVDETALPAEFGPITDIDGNPASQNQDASGSYQILPVRLRVTYATSGGGSRTVDRYVIIGND